ncbi:MAG: DUF2442 domain-containing protein [bacterium]
MSFDVISAEYVGEYKIKLTFENGKSGVVDFLPYTRKGGVFARFKDLKYFKQFEVNRDLGTISWRSEVDIAPETLYSKAIGEPLPQWMEEKVMLK